MRKVDDGEKKEKREKIVATNFFASQPSERRPLVPKEVSLRNWLRKQFVVNVTGLRNRQSAYVTSILNRQSVSLMGSRKRQSVPATGFIYFCFYSPFILSVKIMGSLEFSTKHRMIVFSVS